MSPGPPPTRVRWWEDEGDRGATTEQATPAPAPPSPPPQPPAQRPRGRARRRVLWVGLPLVVAVAAGAVGFGVLESASRQGAPAPAPIVRDGPSVPRVPVVEAPRDLSGYTRSPCSMLENRQARDLGYTSWSTRRLPDGLRECRFVVDDPEWTLTLSALDGRDGSAFADLHRDRPPVFESLEIDGLPAVRTQAFATSELCRVTVGVAEGQSLRVDAAVPDDSANIPVTDPCARAVRGAQEAVTNLPAAP